MKENDKLINYILASFLFLAFNIPSLKIVFINHELVNVIIIIGFLAVGIVKVISDKEIPLLEQKGRGYYWLLLMFLWIVLIVSGLVSNYAELAMVDLAKYLSVCLAFSTAFLALERKEIKLFLFFHLAWSILVSTLRLMGFVNLNPSLGENYLVMGFPLSIGLLVAVALFFTKNEWGWKALALLGVILNTGALSQLSGRASILFPTILIIVYIIYYNWKNQKFLWLYSTLGGFIVIAVAGWFLSPALRRTERMMDLFTSIEDEPRVDVYQYYIDRSLDNLLGYGLNAWAADENYGYPHNFFLEIFYSTGLFGLVISIIIIFLLLKYMLSLIKNWEIDFIVVGSIFVALHSFLTWNVSFDLSSSYLLFLAMALVVINYFELNYKKLNNRNL
ncbi:O-antigen ligase family protein [Marinococcus luteus]|uniref:O-antigen ligase family protein n=1 Tax=Marinococcus luteus TaxID=1122204 RepID=UPI002ACC7046|nr:O-antigen ligase family protein [Marinococcus luteus]MDZ5782819.1 hypothetical protein [Marinococcus luteus]